MSVQKIIQESLNKNPLGMKEALEEELRARVAAAISAKMEEVEQIDEALSPEEKRKAREANRTAGRSASRDDDREFYHSQFRGKKGAEKTSTGVDPIKRTVTMPHAMTKVGKHGHSSPSRKPDAMTSKSNRLTSLHRSRNVNKLVKGKLPEEVEQIDEISQEKLRDYHAKAGIDRNESVELDEETKMMKDGYYVTNHKNSEVTHDKPFNDSKSAISHANKGENKTGYVHRVHKVKGGKIDKQWEYNGGHHEGGWEHFSDFKGDAAHHHMINIPKHFFHNHKE